VAGLGELIGIALVGYGMWYVYKGLVRLLTGEKDWWRPTSRRQRYPYPAAGIMLGLVFAVLGLRFALNYVWEQAKVLSYVGVGLFVVVMTLGVTQPRFLHPRWLGRLQDRLGKQRLMLLQGKARQVDGEEWGEIVATESSFDAWVNRNAPSSSSAQERRPRGYAKNRDRESDK
jgi:hypothetical protein